MPETCRTLISYISAISKALPEFEGVPGVKKSLPPERLETTVMAIVDRNRQTTCSMVWDMRAGRDTENRYMNGYCSRRGNELGVLTPLHHTFVDRIEERIAMQKGKIALSDRLDS